MPNKKALPLLTGGLNEKTRPDLIDDNQLQVCTNYEIKGDGFLYKRKEAEEYDSGLTTAIEAVFSSVSFISEPWYPKTLLKKGTDEMDSDFILFVFGTTSGGAYELHIFFTISGTWTNVIVDSSSETLTTYLTAADITYASDIGSDIEIAFATDSVFIVDGVNNSYMVSIDTEGVLFAGTAGIPAPTNKASVTQVTTWNENQWENNSTELKLGDPGFFQCIYTAVTKTGEESNPSPLSDTLDLQFFNLDEVGADERWVEKVDITDLSIPDVSAGIVENLKYFKIYMRIIRYSEGEGSKTLELTQQFEIISKKDSSGNILTSGTTGNNYTLIIEPTAGETPSYENDVAPVAKTVDFLGGIAMLGDVQTKIKFPWDFKYHHAITIQNSDTESYVDAIIRIRLRESDIDDFAIDDFVYDNGGWDLRKEGLIRLFDSDLTTPLMVVYNGKNDSSYVSVGGENNYIDLFIKIPLLPSGAGRLIYLCWTPTANEADYPGVPDEYNDLPAYNADDSWNTNIGIHYGRFHVVGDVWERQQVWSGERVKANSLICSPIENIRNVYIVNKANDALNGEIGEESSIKLNSFRTIPTVSMPTDVNTIGSYTLIDEATGYTYNKKGIQYEASSVLAPPETGYLYGVYKQPVDQYQTYHADWVEVFSTIIQFEKDVPLADAYQTAFSLYWVVDPTDLVQGWYITNHTGTSNTYLQGSGTTHQYARNFLYNTYFFFFMSWDERDMLNAKYTVATYNLEFNDISELKINEWQTSDPFRPLSALDGIKNISVLGGTRNMPDGELDFIQVVQGTYINQGDTIKNIINLMPVFDSMIGYKYSETGDAAHNNNITFSETKEITLKPGTW